ncbi:hypothetical protein [Amycolatopsis sp. NPDC059657]|uniref:hypothetical protein n=1 Tax=Amycolatopsis sp. NPDC059657 TaxID=3346899 RepID=UPI00366B8A4A
MLKKTLLGPAAAALFMLGAANPAHVVRGTVDLFDNANFDWSAGGPSAALTTCGRRGRSSAGMALRTR